MKYLLKLFFMMLFVESIYLRQTNFPTITDEIALEMAKCVNTSVEACSRSLDCDSMLPVEIYEALKQCENKNDEDGYNCHEDKPTFTSSEQIIEIFDCQKNLVPNADGKLDDKLKSYEDCMRKLVSDFCPEQSLK